MSRSASARKTSVLSTRRHWGTQGSCRPARRRTSARRTGAMPRCRRPGSPMMYSGLAKVSLGKAARPATAEADRATRRHATSSRPRVVRCHTERSACFSLRRHARADPAGSRIPPARPGSKKTANARHANTMNLAAVHRRLPDFKNAECTWLQARFHSATSSSFGCSASIKLATRSKRIEQRRLLVLRHADQLIAEPVLQQRRSGGEQAFTIFRHFQNDCPAIGRSRACA